MKSMKKILMTALGLIALAVMFIPLKGIAVGVSLGAMFNFGSVNFNGEEERDFAKVIMDDTFKQPAMTEFHTVIDGVQAKQQAIYAGLLSKITKADAGCGTGATSKAIALRQVLFNPVKTKVWLQLCASELDSSLGVYATAKGTNKDDLINSGDARVIQFLRDSITPAMLEDAYRITWFGDTTHTNVGDGSGTEQIKAGVSLTDYTILDGFWKQIFAIVAADSTKRVTCTQNAQATYALQDSTLGATAARDYFKDLLTKSDYRLQGAPDKVIISTMSLVNNYADYLESVAVDASFVRLESGFTALKRRNTLIIGWDFWDRTIRADFDNGTKWFSPHRAILTTKGNLQIALDNAASVQELELWYSQDTEKNNMRGKYMVDAKIPSPIMIQALY